MKSFMMAFLIGGLLIVSACGRMSAPQPPEGAIYPHQYVVTP